MFPEGPEIEEDDWHNFTRIKLARIPSGKGYADTFIQTDP
jgi:hypothetical protein